MADYVVWLDDPDCHRIDVSGGKGASLGQMRSLGVQVPPGFVVTPAALVDSLTKQGLRHEIENRTAAFVSGPNGSGVAHEIQTTIMAAPIWAELAQQISKAYVELGVDVFVAVRSSACAEDSEAASFAGQQESFLNVLGPDRVVEKVVECWASFFSERALFYRQSKGSLADLGMAVVVQRQIASEKSGVMFTIDPIRQRRDQMVIEAALGLGEALVSGSITPDNYIARRDGRLKKTRVAKQDHMVVRDPSGGTMTVVLDDEVAATQVLTEVEIAKLVAVGLELETAFGSPQDIEWAFEADELFVLQSRPITT